MEYESSKLDLIAKALIEVQKSLTHVGYDCKNPHFRSKYASLPAVIDHCKTALHDNGICPIQQTIIDINGPALKTTLFHVESGQYISSILPLMMDKLTSQGQGSAITYARRYCLLTAVGISQGEDDDGNAAEHQTSTQTQQTKTRETISSDQYKAIAVLLEKNKPLEALILDYLKQNYQCKSIAECPAEDYDKLYKRALKEHKG